MYKEYKVLACQDKVSLVVRRAHSSVVEHRTAVPVVIGSNPIVPFFFFSKEGGRKEGIKSKIYWIYGFVVKR